MTEFTTWRSLVDGAEISAIPDSVAYHWQTPISGESEGSNPDAWPGDSGAQEVSDIALDGITYREDAFGSGRDALDGDGTDNGRVDINGYESELDGNVAHGFTFASEDTGSWRGPMLFGVDDINNSFWLVTLGETPNGGTEGAITVFYRDTDGNNLEFETVSSSFDDGDPYDVLIQKNGNDFGDCEIWIDQSEVDITELEDQGFNGTVDFPDGEIGVWCVLDSDGDVQNESDTEFERLTLYDDYLPEGEDVFWR